MKATTFNSKQVLFITVLAFLTFSINVNANEPDKHSAGELLSENFVDAVEPQLVVENWMINEDYWTLATPEYSLESEASLGLENWMTDNSFWTAVSYMSGRDRFEASTRDRDFAQGKPAYFIRNFHTIENVSHRDFRKH